MYLEAFIEPFGTLWFIYLLPIFFVVTKLTRGVPVVVIWTVLAALEIAHIQTGWTAIDEFANRFVYFYTGYILAPAHLPDRRRRAGAAVDRRRRGSPCGRCSTASMWRHGLDGLPFISLALGLIGAVAVVAVSALIAKSDLAAPLRWLGKNSIVVYLAFFLGMAGSRAVLLKTGIIPDLGTVALMVTASRASRSRLRCSSPCAARR